MLQEKRRYAHCAHILFLGYNLYMLRNLLMLLGLLVAFLPYLGFPYEWNRFVWTTAGLLVFFMVFFSRRGVSVSSSIKEVFHMQNDTRSLHVERREVEDRPEVHIEREMTIDTTPENGIDELEMTTEKSVTIKRKHRKQASDKSVLQEQERVGGE